MIDKVVKLKNGLEYYIVDQIEMDSKTYIMAVSVNNELENINNEFVICQLVYDLNSQSLKDIDDKKLYEKISIEFLNRLNNK